MEQLPKVSLGLMAGEVREVAVAKKDYSMVRAELSRKSWQWPGVWLFITDESAVDHG